MLHHGHPFSLDGGSPTTQLGAPWNMTTLQETGDAHETIPAIGHKKPLVLKHSYGKLPIYR
jgi:hypothetical protein